MTRYRWIVLAVVWAAYLNVYVTRLLIGPMAPFLKEAFSLSNLEIGSLASASAILYAPVLVFGGFLVDRLGVRRMLTFGTISSGLCVIAIFFAPYYQAMFFILLLSGIGTGCIFPSSVKAIMQWFPSRERATVLGFNQAAINVGGIVGAALLPIVAITLGWRFGFLFVGLLAVAIGVCCLAFYHDPPREPKLDEKKPERMGIRGKSSVNKSTIKLFKSRDIWMLGLACLFISVVEFAAMAHLVDYLTENLFFGVVAAGGLLALTQAAGGFGKPISGFMSDWLMKGRRKVIFMFMGGATALVCVVLGIFGPSVGWLLYPLLIIIGIGATGWGGLYATMAGEIGGKELAGIATGTSGAILSLGSIAGPPLFGYLADATGSFGLAWLAMAVSAVASVVLASFIREPADKTVESIATGG